MTYRGYQVRERREVCMELQCAKCGTYWPAGRSPGSICGIMDETGRACNGNLLPCSMLRRSVTPTHRLDLKCNTCGSVCSSGLTGKMVWDRCHVRNCNGRLERYWG